MASHRRSNAPHHSNQHQDNNHGHHSSGADNNRRRPRDETAPGRGAGGCYQGAGPYGWEEDDAWPDAYSGRRRAQPGRHASHDDEVYNDRRGFDHPARHAYQRDTQHRADQQDVYEGTLQAHGNDTRRQQGINPTHHRKHASSYAGRSQPAYQGYSAQNDARQADNDRMQRRSQEVSQRGRGPSSYTRSDVRIAEDINERLTDDDVLDATDIRVSVSEGVVTLSGAVTSRWMRHLAEDIADDCSGVKDIHNEITVAGAGPRTTRNIGAGSSSGKATDD